MEHVGREKEAIINPNWVHCLENADMCQSGQILMKELLLRIPSRKLMEDEDKKDQNLEGTDEDLSEIEEGHEENIKSNKKWWKNIFPGFVGGFGIKNPRKSPPPLPIRPHLKSSQVEGSSGKGGRLRAFTTVITGLIPNSSTFKHLRVKRWPF